MWNFKKLYIKVKKEKLSWKAYPNNIPHMWP